MRGCSKSYWAVGLHYPFSRDCVMIYEVDFSQSYGNTLTFHPISVPGVAVSIFVISVFCLKHRHSRESQDSAAWGMQLCPGRLSKFISPWPQHPWTSDGNAFATSVHSNFRF